MDIRAFIEYHSASDRWRTHSEVFLERDYDLFVAIGKPGGEEDSIRLFEPRGFPADASAFAQRGYYAHIVPDDEFVHDGLSRFVRASDVAGIVKMADITGINRRTSFLIPMRTTLPG